MAKNKSTVYLGYQDEEITAKHGSLLNSTVNKIGGAPDWPIASGEIKVPSCVLCGAARPLIVQLYAPLEQSQFHRSLYIFACLNPACSQNSKSWACIRTQHLETTDVIGTLPANSTESIGGGNNGGASNKKKKNVKQQIKQKIAWCGGVDDWGDYDVDTGNEMIEAMDTAADDFSGQNEQNGNVITKNDNLLGRLVFGDNNISATALQNNADEDDDDEDSNSMENDLICGFAEMDMHLSQNLGEDPNANCAAAAVVGAEVNTVGGFGDTTSICAEIEGDETDVVLVETPEKPERDLIALLKHTSCSTPLGPMTKMTDVNLQPFFMAVDIEVREQDYDSYNDSLSADHIRDLYQEYKRQDEATQSPNGTAKSEVNIGNGSGGADGQEAYEEALPAHGDLIFYQFLSALQRNPGQILRYTRDAFPLLIAPLNEAAPKCPNCNGETICEVQILSTLIPKLYLQQNNEAAPIEFGNVLVFTCLKSCWDTPDKMRYERIIVQAEK